MFKTLNMRKITVAVALSVMLCLTACKKNESQTDEDPQEDSQILGRVLNGSDASKVRIEVFSDLECPACRELFVTILQPVMRDYQDKVSVVYYEFPLSGHRYARRAAQYVAAASRLGQRQALSVYEAIFTDQVYWAADGRLEDSVSRALSNEDFMRTIQILNNENSLNEINEAIEKELQLGMRKGVTATPTVFISYDGRQQKVEGRPTYQVMKQFLDPLVK